MELIQYISLAAYGIIQIAAGSWQRNVASTNAPTFKAAGGSATNGSYMYYAGGLTKSGSTATYYQTLMRLDVSKSPPVWTSMGNLYAKMAFSKGWLDVKSGTLFISGGYTGGTSLSMTTFTSAAATASWQLQTFSNNAGWGYESAAWAYNNYIWVIGGYIASQSNLYCPGIWRTNNGNNQWARQTISGTLPTYVNGGRIYGVVNSDATLDLFVTGGYTTSS